MITVKCCTYWQLHRIVIHFSHINLGLYLCYENINIRLLHLIYLAQVLIIIIIVILQFMFDNHTVQYIDAGDFWGE